jgi:hypothetical protein
MEHSRSLKEVMKDYPKEVILTDGSGVTLRPLKEGDEAALFGMFNRLSEDDLWFLNHDVSGSGLVDDWVKNLDPKRVISIVALLKGSIIANALFREKRLGTWMLLDLVNLAMAIGLKMLVMRLVQDRDSSVINGVRKLGFVEEAVLKDYVLDREENPHNLVIMVKHLPMEWGDF